MKRNPKHRQPSALRRWLRFNLVGLIGVGVQLALLQLLLATTTLDYRVATLVAVEMTVLHNFVWHLRFTWRERRLRSLKVVLRRLMEFHLTNGTVSLAGSWTLMALLVGRARFPVIVANLVSIGVCSLVNFLLAEILVFRTPIGGRRSKGRSLQMPNRPPHPRDASLSFTLPSTCADR
jgi:putative flippase GtrA